MAGALAVPGWVPTRAGAVFTVLHPPRATPRSTAVLLLPPFGWEGVCAARSLRTWARELADDGYSVVRMHLPGSGDSEGLGAAQDLTSWTAAVVDVIAQTRVATACTHLTVVGLGLGGLIALNAADAGARIDDLVTWATPAKGRLLLREIRAFAAMTDTRNALVPSQPQSEPYPDDGSLWVNGFPLGPAAQEQLGTLDATKLDLSSIERAMVLGRGTLPPDRALAAALGVAAQSGPGFDELTGEPRLSRPPREVMALVREWLRPTIGPAAGPGFDYLEGGDEQVRLGSLDAVVTRAQDAQLTAVFLSAGAVYRSGPNRLWAEAAQRWRAWGISSIRVDLYGIGEASGWDSYPHGPEGFYDEAYRTQVQRVLDNAAALGLPDRFLLVGLCSGAYWSAQIAMPEPRVVGLALLNPVSLVWPPPLLSADSRQYLTSAETWLRLLRNHSLRKEVLRRALKSLQLAVSRLRKESARPLANSLAVLKRLSSHGTLLSIGVSPGEPILGELNAYSPMSFVKLRQFDGADDAHTMATPELRYQAEQLMDDVARAALAQLPVSPSPALVDH